MDSKKFYVFGPLDVLRSTFPAYAGNDVREAVDGSDEAIYEVALSPEEYDALPDSLTARTHEEAIAFLNGEGRSTFVVEPAATPKKYTESNLSSKTKADLVAIASGEFGLDVDDSLTNAALRAAILASQEGGVE